MTVAGQEFTTPKLVHFDAENPETKSDAVVETIRRDGGVIVQNLISHELAMQIKQELKPHFDSDRIDPTGFFPETTKRASGLIAISPGCVNGLLSSTYSFWLGKKVRTVHSKPQISSTTAFRVNPGGRAQELHRDDA